MKRIIILVLITSLFISGCSHGLNITKYDSSLQFYKKINNMCEGVDNIILRTTDGKELKVNNFVMMPDSSQYINLLNNKPEFINTDSLKEMEYKETAWGIIDGATLGCLSGFTVSALISWAAVPKGDGWGAIGAAMITFAVTILGLVGGGIWGGLHLSTIILDLQQHHKPVVQK